MLVMTGMLIPAPFALAADHDHGQGTEAAVSNLGIATGLISVGAISALMMGIAAAILIVRIRANSSTLSPMNAMMAAMAVAMMTGLIGGTVFGIWLQSLFYSTVIGVTIGMAAGMVAGQAHSWLAALDGMLSGVMSGMMGAMLGVMIAQDHPVIMILFLDAIMLLALGILNRLIRNPSI
ncbi:hypothetical protein A8708_22345 [Paenibacillus oryzisoli]|uniref:Uncharacterized protein n=2 Tax=Paenibacillus oryzisoli TaxID=1850517 RepID=A0A198A0T7_9BACL|nr:hypothetical protein A8708_22345 [Paenibacillus oryzisoli]